MNNQKLARLIELFLQMNPEPSDQQFHALAEAVGVDKETLESVAYEMLGDEIHHEQEEGDDAQLNELVEGVSTHFPEGEEEEDFGVVNASMRLKATEEVTQEGGGQGEEGLSEQQEVLQGEGDPATTNTDNLTLNDGAPEGTTTDDEMQDSMLIDGVGEDDTGVGLDADKSMLLNDGAPALQLTNAALRLATSFNKLIAMQLTPDEERAEKLEKERAANASKLNKMQKKDPALKSPEAKAILKEQNRLIKEIKRLQGE